MDRDVQGLRASIIIPAWNQWASTRTCLDALRRTLRPNDEVIVVDNGSTDGTAAGLRAFPWVRVVSLPENLGFAGGCNRGAAAASGDVLVFLNNDTLCPNGWLEPLVATLQDATVGAAGPRSNYVSGEQLAVEADYRDRSGLWAFARRWRADHRDIVSETERLVGFCLAVRRADFGAVGGFCEEYGIGGYEDDDLCASLLARDLRLVIAHESFVHHDGHKTFDANGLDWYDIEQANQEVFERRHPTGVPRPPLVSACLIVKDEQDQLADCLASLHDVADEIVVYDTGSSDDTVTVAKAMGATVVEGSWNDDFGAARNAALAACRGVWILQLDADERLLSDPRAFRALLRGSAMVDALSVQIENERAEGAVGVVHRAVRVFRSQRGMWQGRLHEQVVARQGQAPLRHGEVPAVRIRHLGYRSDVVDQRSKATRNLSIARRDLDDGAGHRADLLLNVARSTALIGNDDEALDLCLEVLEDDSAAPEIRLGAALFRAERLLGLRRADEALVAVQDLRRVGEHEDICGCLENHARLQLGDLDAAQRLTATTTVESRAGWSVDLVAIRTEAALALFDGERWADAATAMLALVRSGNAQPLWGSLAVASARGGMSAPEVAEAVTESDLRMVLAELGSADPSAADAVVEELHGRWPSDPRILAFAAVVAPRLPVERAAAWSVRLRAAGAEDRCPVRAIAGDDLRDPAERLLACALLVSVFGTDAAELPLPTIAKAVDRSQFPARLLELSELAPTLLPAFITACATSESRTMALADALESLGAAEQADVLRSRVETLNPVG
jgi:GT2 family glycosyltransferase